MSEAKQLKLNKVANEFNLALTTIIEFLTSKGHKVDANPFRFFNSISIYKTKKIVSLFK